jgi:5-formyltetrahydrofolate cyclo-ligase
MRATLQAISAKELRKASSAIMIKLIEERSLWPTEGAVALFAGMAGEVELLPLIAWLRGRNLMPVFFEVNEKLLVPRVVTEADDLEKNAHGVLQPRNHCREIPLELLRVVMVPGLAFGKKDLSRLGRGKGYYDRLFADPRSQQVKRVGVCLEAQLLAKLPKEEHDVPMHLVVTEDAWLKPSE